MKYCSHCDRSLSVRHLRCRICKNYNWRLPHIAFSVAVLTLTILMLIAFDKLSYPEQSPPRPAQQINQSAPPLPEQIKQYRQTGGRWRGRPAE